MGTVGIGECFPAAHHHRELIEPQPLRMTDQQLRRPGNCSAQRGLANTLANTTGPTRARRHPRPHVLGGWRATTGQSGPSSWSHPPTNYTSLWPNPTPTRDHPRHTHRCVRRDRPVSAMIASNRRRAPSASANNTANWPGIRTPRDRQAPAHRSNTCTHTTQRVSHSTFRLPCAPRAFAPAISVQSVRCCV